MNEEIEDKFRSFINGRQNKEKELTAEIHEVLKVCQSPLEKIFLIGFCEKFDIRWSFIAEDYKRLIGNLFPYPGQGNITVEIEPQAEIKIDDSNLPKVYRADFYIEILSWEYAYHISKKTNSKAYSKYGKPIIKLIVEIDGHNFHERTKEQARYDKTRDRRMVTQGYTVFRYAGTEVYQNLEKILKEIGSYLADITNKYILSKDTDK